MMTMTVKDLIRELRKLDNQNARIIVNSKPSGDVDSPILVGVTNITDSLDGSNVFFHHEYVETKRLRDVFDASFDGLTSGGYEQFKIALDLLEYSCGLLEEVVGNENDLLGTANTQAIRDVLDFVRAENKKEEVTR